MRYLQGHNAHIICGQSHRPPQSRRFSPGSNLLTVNLRQGRQMHVMLCVTQIPAGSATPQIAHEGQAAAQSLMGRVIISLTTGLLRCLRLALGFSGRECY
ncbi:MAG: hypothetical protein ACI8PG_002777 [Planctomycetota bacterium]|jgi:hypothetical protein